MTNNSLNYVQFPTVALHTQFRSTGSTYSQNVPNPRSGVANQVNQVRQDPKLGMDGSKITNVQSTLCLYHPVFTKKWYYSRGESGIL